MTPKDDLVERVAEAIELCPTPYISEALARAAIAECEKDHGAKIAKLEAQCAAMRAALETAKLQVITLHPGHDPRGEEYADQIQIEVLDAIDAALLPDAGQKVLEVLRIATEVCSQDTGDVWSEDSGWVRPTKPETINALETALSPLGWKP